MLHFIELSHFGHTKGGGHISPMAIFSGGDGPYSAIPSSSVVNVGISYLGSISNKRVNYTNPSAINRSFSYPLRVFCL